MVVLVALAMALAAGTAYAAYRVYTDVWLPAQQAQNERTVEAPEEITYSVETRSMDVSVPVDPYDAPGKREAQKWYYPHIEASTQSDAVDKINFCPIAAVISLVSLMFFPPDKVHKS